ncbi:unnamed protein product [Phytophthora fragariaefolia]|uniref:Unnamed protein product n=1 Tax=Phytophthora fragariaefolia TaxID=1490495 RepID=A0A9W6U956_9STRA|nr:unnamed protein product [Phytophthora fragariaefolia]
MDGGRGKAKKAKKKAAAVAAQAQAAPEPPMSKAKRKRLKKLRRLEAAKQAPAAPKRKRPEEAASPKRLQQPKHETAASPKRKLQKLRAKAADAAAGRKQQAAKEPPQKRAAGATTLTASQRAGKSCGAAPVSVAPAQVVAGREDAPGVASLQADASVEPSPAACGRASGKRTRSPRGSSRGGVATIPLKTTTHSVASFGAPAVAAASPTRSRETAPAVSSEQEPATRAVPTVADATAAPQIPEPRTRAQPDVVGASNPGTAAKAATATATSITQETHASSKLVSAPSVKATPSSHSTFSTGGLKRRRSIDHSPTRSEPSHPPAKKGAAGTKVSAVDPKPQAANFSHSRSPDYVQRKTQDQEAKPRVQRTLAAADTGKGQLRDPQVKIEAPLKAEKVVVVPANSASLVRTQDVTPDVAPVQHTPADAATGKEQLRDPPVKVKAPLRAEKVVVVPANSASMVRTHDIIPGVAPGQSKSKAKTTVKPNVPTLTRTKSKDTTSVPAVTTSKSRGIDIIMDSHVYVQKMMRGELETNKCHRDSPPEKPAELTVALPPRPQNAWGASFGMVPPTKGASSAPQTCSTTPLSSWFLSKGCANFIKQVHFSDDDDVSGSSDDDDSTSLQSAIGTPRGADKASPKRKTSFVKKNAFLESLKTQSDWRSWYGNVDMRNLLDPPLAHIPEQLQTYDATPLQLPEATESSTPDNKLSELEILEADIRYVLIFVGRTTSTR